MLFSFACVLVVVSLTGPVLIIFLVFFFFFSSLGGARYISSTAHQRSQQPEKGAK
jgi:hypothetical protein